MTIPITNHHQKKIPKTIPPLSKKSPSVHTHENSPCPAASHPLHSAPDEKKIRSQKPPSQRRRRTKKKLGELPIRTVHNCRGVVIKSHTCLFSGVTPYIHTYNSTDMIPRNLPKVLCFTPLLPPNPYHPTSPLGHPDVLSLSLSLTS